MSIEQDSGRGLREPGAQRPIMVLLDLLSRRWTLRLVWELREEPLTFRELRTAADSISPTVMQARLDDLRAAGLVGLAPRGYQLTSVGRELFKILMPLHRFAEEWAVGDGLEALRHHSVRSVG